MDIARERVDDVAAVDAGKVVNTTCWNNLKWIERDAPTDGGIELRKGCAAHVFCVGDCDADVSRTINDLKLEGRIHEGHWGLSPANDFFRVEWESNRNAKVSQVTIPDGVLQERLQHLELDTFGFEALPTLGFESNTLSSCVKLLSRESGETGLQSQLLVDGLTQTFVDSLLASSNLKGTSRLRRSLRTAKLSPSQKLRAIRYLHDNLSLNPSLSDVALEVGLSPFHFSRQFKRTFGKTLHRYQLEIRVEKSMRLLTTTSPQQTANPMSLAAIAVECGFCDQSHLHRAFKRVVGKTPGQYLSES